MKARIAVLAAIALISAACEVEPADGAGGTIQSSESDAVVPAGAEEEVAEEEVAEETAPETSDLGTRGNPAPIGETASIGDWDVRIVSVDRDASAIIAEENQFNDAPADGSSFVMWEVEATYTGSESGSAWIDLSWKIVGSEGNSFESGFDNSCGVIPNDLFDAGETFPGASVTGNVCIAAETAQLDGGTILVEELFGSSRTFFAIP